MTKKRKGKLVESGLVWLRCYVCGEKIKPDFCLAFNSEGTTDRVFVAHIDCSQQFDGATVIFVTAKQRAYVEHRARRD